MRIVERCADVVLSILRVYRIRRNGEVPWLRLIGRPLAYCVDRRNSASVHKSSTSMSGSRAC